MYVKCIGKADVPIEEEDTIICSLSDPPMEVNVNVNVVRLINKRKYQLVPGVKVHVKTGKAQQTSQLHPGQLFFFQGKKKSRPGWDLNPRHSAV